MINIHEEVKILLWRNNLSMRKLAIKLRELGINVPANSGLSNKFNNKTIRFDEVQNILDYLGYEIIIKEKQK